MSTINKFRGKYEFLSNFFPSSIIYKGKTYPTAEHLFQALKTKDESTRAKIRKAKTPGAAKKLGRQASLRSDWERGKNNLMFMVVRLKFQQNLILQSALLNTGDDILIEGNWWHDNYWGKCTCPKCDKIKGYNILGKTLMKVRTIVNSIEGRQK